MPPFSHTFTPIYIQMNELAKWVWLILLALLFMGYWFFAVVALDVAIYILVLWLKPEWLNND